MYPPGVHLNFAYAYLTITTSCSPTNVEGTIYTIQRYQYDRDANPTAMTYPSGRIFTYRYDYAGRPLTITTPGATLVSTASYLPFGPMTALTYGNGSRKEMTYDSRYRVQTNRMLGVFGSPIASYAYQYDPAGNITRIDDTIDASFNRQFGYDDLAGSSPRRPVHCSGVPARCSTTPWAISKRPPSKPPSTTPARSPKSPPSSRTA